MQCRTCRARLTVEDNYCRKCGAAVEVIDVQVVRTTPAGPVATLRSAALPIVKQSATVFVAGTLLRLAVKQLISRQASGQRLLPWGNRSIDSKDESIVEEVLYYRRVKAR
jgi:hypothetical protein